MKDVFDGIKAIFELLQSIFDFFVNGIKACIQLMQTAFDSVDLVTDVISAMPPLVVPFMLATFTLIILYFIISFISG